MLTNRRLLWALLALCTCTALFTVAYPMYVIRPFRAQGAAELAAALQVRRYGPPVALAVAVAALPTAYLLWRMVSRRLMRAAAASGAALTVTFAVLAHINVFEMIFHRIPAPDFVVANKAQIDADDMVLAIRVGDQARAYPIRMMGYHHIVNDWVGRAAVVGTY